MSDSHHPVPDHLFYNIGLIAAKWAAIEADIEFTLLEMFQIKPEIGLIITSRLATRSKTDLLGVVLRHEATTARDDAAFDLLKRLDAAYIERNACVHSVWAGTATPEIAERASIQAKGRLKFGYTSVHINELETLVETLSRLGSDLQEFRNRRRRAKDGEQSTS